MKNKNLVATTASFSKDKRRCQVTVLIGEGSSQRSTTLHLHKEGASWVGLNPDKRAIPLNELYEQELTEAQSELANAEATLKSLKKRLEKMEAEKDDLETVVDEAMLDELKADLAKAITSSELRVYAAEAIVDAAEEKLAIVRCELPLKVNVLV